MRQIGGTCVTYSKKILFTSEHRIFAGAREIICNKLTGWPLLDLGHALKPTFYCTRWSYQWPNKSRSQRVFQCCDFVKPLLASGDGEGWWGALGARASSCQEKDSFNFSLLPGFPLQPPGVKAGVGSGTSLPHFGRAGGEVVQPHNGRLCKSSRSTESIRAVGEERSSSPNSPPPRRPRQASPRRPEWHQGSSESLKVCGLISGRNRPLLPITAPRSRLATPGARREREPGSGSRERSAGGRNASSCSLGDSVVLAAEPCCWSLPAPRRNPRVREGSCILHGVLSRGLNHSSWLLALKRTGWV